MELFSYYNENNETFDNISPKKQYHNGSSTIISSQSQSSVEQHKKMIRLIWLKFL